MRKKRTIQSSLFDIFASHQIGRELKVMSAWLDGVGNNILDLVVNDLGDAGVMETGRQGLPAESVLRCALLKQYRQLSCEELAFHLEGSSSFRAFARLPLSLWDGVRVLTLKLTESVSLPGGAAVTWRNYKRLARKPALTPILYSRGKDKKARLYKDLIAATQATIASVRRVATGP